MAPPPGYTEPLPPPLADRLARLAPDQRAAATSPPGPVLCIAPAGSGKTTTLVARIAWLIGTGAQPDRICALTFNRRAAEELAGRLAEALRPLGVDPGAVRVRTFHALGREILGRAGQPVEPLVDRLELIREVCPGADQATLRRLDMAFSRLKLDLRVTADEVARDPAPGPVAQAFVAYERAVAATGGLDFDDLVARALRLLETDPSVLATWRTACQHLLVDEAQDVDRSQLELALALAAPSNRIFLVGDDDQSIYGWRLADVRRVLGIADRLPALRRVDLVTNYRCPAPVVERAVRLVEQNRERFAKQIRARDGAEGRLVLAPDGSDGTVRVGRILDRLPSDGATRAILARTNRELLPAIVTCLEREVPFRAPELPLVLESEHLHHLLRRLAEAPEDGQSVLLRLEMLRRGVAATSGPPGDDETIGPADVASAMLAWAPAFADAETFVAAVDDRRARLAAIRRDDASLSLATAHGTKGLEFDHVAVLTDGFPSHRAVTDAAEPLRALEEERRLAYVAWTRARRSLMLVHDPDGPSTFLREAFTDAELGLMPRDRPG